MTVCNFAAHFAAITDAELKRRIIAQQVADWLQSPMEFEAPATSFQFTIVKQTCRIEGTKAFRYQLRHYKLGTGEIEPAELEEEQEFDEELLQGEPSMTPSQRL